MSVLCFGVQGLGLSVARLRFRVSGLQLQSS